MITAYLNTKVEIIRDGSKILDTKANVQEGQIYLGNVDIRELDIIRVTVAGIEYQVTSVHTQLDGNRIIYKKVKYNKVG